MRFFILIILVCLLSVFSVNAEEITGNRFLHTQWTTENGMPQNSVTAIAQTPDGYLWIGTFGGLARFDGVRFKIYTTSNTPELRSNRITALTTDKAGTLWIGTERGELFEFKNGVFSLFDDGNAFDNSGITDIFINDNGVMFIGSFNARICTASGCERLEISDGIIKFKQDTSGTVWAKSSDKLYKLIDRKFIRDESFKEPVLDIESNADGGLWVSSVFDLSLYQNENRQIIKKFDGESTASVIAELPDGELRLSRDKNLYSLNTDLLIKPEPGQLKEGVINKIFSDNQGNLWLGWVSSGLVRLTDQRVQTLTFDAKLGNGNVSDRAVNSIAEDSEGNIWITTGGSLFRSKQGKSVQISGDIINHRTIARGSLLVDGGGKLWQSSSIGLLSYENDKVTVHEDISWTQSHSGNSLFEDSKGNFWYGYYGNGVIVSDGKKVIAKYSTADGLAGNVVSIIIETGDGAIWFGTTTGLSRLQNGEFTNYTTENGLTNDYVRDIYEDQDGTLWIGTYGGGLNRFRSGEFASITTKNGLYDDIVSRILVDENDNFWMLGNRGIFSVNRKMLNDFADGKINNIFCAVFTAADGMITSEGNGGYQNAGIRTRNGKLWFPMINGVVIIDPKQEKLPSPKPLIEEVFLNGKPSDTSKKIEINPGNESLEINYTGFNFRKPEQIRFRYRLKGLDVNWTEAGTRRMVNYPYLPSGDYLFEVVASNADGNWSSEIATFDIVVNPPFYRTWWFFILGWLIFFSILFAVYQSKSWYFERERAKQEEFSRKLINAQESERKRIASEIHDHLGQQLLVIKNWSSYCLQKTRKLTEMQIPIRQINESAEVALNEVRTMAKKLSPYHLDKAGVSNTIRYMVKQVTEFSDMEITTEIDDIDGILSKENELNLYRIVQEASNNIIKHSKASEAHISIKRTENLIKLTVSDNGIGFYQTNLDYENIGIGLHGMAERAKMMSGTFSLQSNENKGVQIIVEIEI